MIQDSAISLPENRELGSQPCGLKIIKRVMTWVHYELGDVIQGFDWERDVGRRGEDWTMEHTLVAL